MNRSMTYLGIHLFTAGFISGCGRLEDSVKTQIELVGSELTGVTVTVDDVTLEIARSLGEIRNFLSEQYDLIV